MSVPAVELGEVCRMDRRMTSASDAISKGLLFVGMEHVDPDTGRISTGKGSRTGEGKGQAFLFDDRHVLFGKLRPYLRKIAFPNQQGCSSTELVPLLPDHFHLDRSYLFHWVRQQSVIDELMSKMTGARMPRADMSVLLKMSIPLPSLLEQKRIAALLERTLELKRLADAALAKARIGIPALFLDMFGDPAANKKAYPEASFSESVRVRSGNFLPAKSMNKDGNFPVYGGNGINGYHSEYMFEEPMIVIGRVGAYCGNVHISRPRSWITDNALYVSDYRKDFAKEYLAMCLTYARLNERASQAGQPLISAGRLASVPLLIPPLPLQNAFVESVRRIESTTHGIKQISDKIHLLNSALASSALRGTGNTSTT